MREYKGHTGRILDEEDALIIARDGFAAKAS
jgi:hypothetical protein